MGLAVERVGAAGLGVVITGASAYLGGRNELGELGAIGGFPSNWMPQSLTPVRPSAMPGVWVEWAAGENGVGVGTLEAVSTTQLRWRAPGDTVGAAVTIAEGESRALFSGTKSKYIVVKREPGALVTGSESVQLEDTYNNWLGGSNWESADALAGATKAGLSVAFVNLRTDGGAVEDVKVWVDPDHGAGTTALASETITVDRIQGVADESATPSGVSWNTGTTEGTGVDLGDLAAPGDWIGLWRKRTIAASTDWSAHELAVVRYSYKVGGVTYTGQVRGLFRISNGTPDADGVVQYELYAENGRDPDPDAGDSPLATGDTKSLSYSGGLGVGVWHCCVLGRNRWGVLSPVDPERVKRIGVSSSDEVVPLMPREPNEVSVLPWVGGKALINVLYLPATEGATTAEVRSKRANGWAIYISYDGTNPLDAEPVVYEMNVLDPDTVGESTLRGREMLRFVTDGAGVEGAPIQVIARTTRDDRQSTNTTAKVATAQRVGPARPRAFVTFEGSRGEAQSVTEADSGTWWIDEARNLRIEYGRGSASLYLDAELVWRCIYDAGNRGRTRIYLNSDWSLKNETITGAGVSEAFEVASWSGTHVLYACVNGQRRMKIDADNQVISAAWFETGLVESVESSAPALPRYADTVFVVFDVYSERMATYLKLGADGVLRNGAGWNQWLTQAEIEGLEV